MNSIRLLTVLIFSVLFFNNSFALIALPSGECTDRTITAAITVQINCDDNDTLTVNSGVILDYDNNDVVEAQDTDGVTIINNGTIQNDGNNFQAPIDGSATRNLTVTNNGTINATKRYGVYIDQAEQVTITNNAGATIKTTYTGTATNEQGAIYGNNIGSCTDGNCYNNSNSNGGEGLTLHNYGTITSYYRTIWGGNNDDPDTMSENITIKNYDGGSIASEFSVGMRFRYVEDFDLYNYSGATIETGTVTTTNANYTVDLQNADDVYINNEGTIKSADDYTIACKECTNSTIINSGTIQSIDNYAIFLRDAENITIENSGTISADGNAIFAEDSTSVTITNSGTIISSTGQKAIDIKETTNAVITNTATGTIETATQVAINANGAINPTITNHGTLKSTVASSKVVDFPQTSDKTGTGGTLTNTGTIINATGGAGQSIRVGDGDGPWNNLKIINSGTISSIGESVLVSGGSGTTGLNITTKGEGTWVGEIDMEDAAVTMTLDCSISKDQDIEIEDKTNMVVVDNLCGNDTYAILDSSKNADPDNSETNGYLRIYGEDLEIDSNNKKYRTEIFLAKLNNIFTATNNNKEYSTYYSTYNRDNIYNNNENGVLGFFEKKDEVSFIDKPFISYSDQGASFNNREYTGSKNLAFGFRKQIQTDEFNVSIVPVAGLSLNKVVDVETETNQIIKKGFKSQFAGINTSISKKFDYDNESNLTLEVSGIYGLHRLPKYLSNFTDGDLSVDDAIDQVLGAGFNVKYSKENTNGFVLEPYLGLSANNTLSNDIEIIADGENKEAGHVMNGVLAKKIGFDLTKNTENFNFAINFNHQDQDGLIENSVNISLSKKIQQISKFRKEREREIPELEKLFDQLQLAKENERLTEIAGKTAEENKVMKELIIQLIKENQKLKTENKLFNNQ